MQQLTRNPQIRNAVNAPSALAAHRFLPEYWPALLALEGSAFPDMNTESVISTSKPLGDNLGPGAMTVNKTPGQRPILHDRERISTLQGAQTPILCLGYLSSNEPSIFPLTNWLGGCYSRQTG